MRRISLKAFVISNAAWLAVAVTVAIALTVFGVDAGYAEKHLGASATVQHVPLSAGEERALKPTGSFKECDICPEMVVMPAGSFIMGSPASEPSREADEGPQHEVTFARQFAVGRFAVTFDEWDACVADAGCNGYRPSDENWGRGRRPVINVSWRDAKAYLAWLSKRTGKTYRLLSEAEREYVTRAGTATPFWWGPSISTSQANYNGGSRYDGRGHSVLLAGPAGEYRNQTLPVDSFSPNPWGLHQVHGNIWEWVEDCSHKSYAGAPSDGSSWTSGDCYRQIRMVRGGSWFDSAVILRSASRLGFNPYSQLKELGFRVARELLDGAVALAR